MHQIKKAQQVLLFLDYDGTLTPIAPKPGMAQLSAGAKEILARISRHSRFQLTIISGRSLAELKALVGLENIAYAGNHGLEIESPQGSFIHPAARQFQPLLREVGKKLREKLAGINGILIEDKGLTLSVHYRLVKETELTRVRQLFCEAIECREMKDRLKVTEGKRVLEVRPPVEWDKGKAIQWLLDIYGMQRSLPIFAGDDVTDEDGFKVLRRVGGISIFVGKDKASSAADYYLNSPEQLGHWLGKLSQS